MQTTIQEIEEAMANVVDVAMIRSSDATWSMYIGGVVAVRETRDGYIQVKTGLRDWQTVGHAWDDEKVWGS